jgi:photosynthetic reaction center H subunit
LHDFHVAAGRDPRGKAVVAGDGEVIGRVVDIMVDIPEQLVRYLVIDVNPEGTGKIRLAPITMTRVKSDRVTVRSLYSGQFDDIPQTASASVVTKLEEDKIMGWFGGGTMYADPKRAEPKL